VASELSPRTAHDSRVGRSTLLPVLLGGVLPCAGEEALTEYLMLLLAEGKEASPWGLRHRAELLPVLQFVGTIEDIQLEMLKVVHLLVASPSAVSRQAAALLATALACRLGEHAVERRLLPALARLTEDKSRQVCVCFFNSPQNCRNKLSSSVIWDVCLICIGLWWLCTCNGVI
jgi:hypothetical protein